MEKVALITGATSGIGRATAVLLAKQGFNVIITGRREELLSQVSAEITSLQKGKVVQLKFDICNYNEVHEALNSLTEKWRTIDLLINNAGLALGYEPLNEGLLSDWEIMIDTNIKGLLYVSKLVSEGMIKRKQGHIINVASIAGKEAYASGNVYCATKSAVISLTQGMRIDWVKHGIKVGCISPGMVETEFSQVRFHGDIVKATQVYKGVDPLTANDIAEAILFMATRPPHVNIDDMLIMATAQAFSRETIRKTGNK
jgi:3-hydroxy acid dehydrogenase / malonic semialdehyde reductase